MALKNPRALFGVHQFSPYSRSTGEFFGTVKCLTGSSMSLSGEQVKLEGGSNKYSWATESGKITAEVTIKMREYPAFVFELFFGKAATESFTASPGEVVGLANIKGESILDAVSSVAVTGAQSLKFGKYILKAIDSDTLAVHVSTDIDFSKGQAAEYTAQDLKVAEINVVSGDNAIPGFGIKLVASSPSFVAGDTAEFTVLPGYSEKLEVTIGGIGETTPEFGAVIMGEKRGDGSIVAIDAFRLKAAGGMPMGFEQGAFSESEVKLEAMYDSAKNGVFKFLSIKET
jgi:hypothetical protein